MNRKRFLGILLTLALALWLMVGMSLMAYATTDTYTQLKNNKTEVTFNGHKWYIIEDNSTAVDDAGTVTLLAADTSFGTSIFHDS